MEQLFFSFWWLIFPLFGMAMGFFGMINHFQNRRETLKMIKSYVDQGKEPPESLIKAMNSEPDSNPHYRRRGRGNPFVIFIVFASLAAAFAYVGFYQGIPIPFQALGIGFGIAAIGNLIAAIFMRNPPRD